MWQTEETPSRRHPHPGDSGGTDPKVGAGTGTVKDRSGSLMVPLTAESSARRAIGSPEEEKRLNLVYRSMPARDFSADVLQKCPEALIVLELSGVTWSDWGRPERIRETLRAIGKKPAFAEEHDDRDRPSELNSAWLYST